MNRSFAPRTAFAIVVFALGGCAAAPSSKAPETPEAPEAPASTAQPSAEPVPEEGDIEALEDALARDESTLQSLLRTEAAAGPADVPSADSPPPPPATPAPPKQPRATAAGAATDSLEFEAGERPCDRACRALASMRRAAEGICRLANDDVERCNRAQSRVASAEDLVRSSGCSC